jgi:ATP-dependent DNA ligase
VSPTGTDSPIIPATDDWRPMAFGARHPDRIKDPVCEPLWAGVRVLVEAGHDAVRIRDVDGVPITGFPDLEAEILGSMAATELVLDGYLMPAPLGELIDLVALMGISTGPSAGQMVRQVMFGGMRPDGQEDRLNPSEGQLIVLRSGEPAAFVAIDLLWLDGEALLGVPLQERKRLLDSVLVDHELVRRTVYVRPPLQTWYRQWRSFGFREFAVKNANSRYTPGGESNDWATARIPKG